MFFSVGVAEVVALSLLGVFSVPIPVGLPPKEPDAILLNMAPEPCLFYAAWSAMDQPDPASSNRTERLLAEPDVRRVVTELDARLQRFAEEVARRERLDRPQAMLLLYGPKLTRLLLKHAACFYVKEVIPGEGPAGVEGVLAVNLAEDLEEGKNIITGLTRELLPQAPSQVTIAGSTFSRLTIPGPQIVITWGFHDRYFLIGVGRQAIEGALDRASTPPPEWLVQARERLPVDRPATISYGNLQTAINLAAGLAGQPGTMVADLLGLNSLMSYQAITGLDRQGVKAHTLLRLRSPLSGLLALVDTPGLEAQHLQGIPSDALLAAVWRLDPPRVLDRIMMMLDRAGVGADFREELEEFERAVGVQIRDELLASLGDVWQVYAARSDGGVLTGWTLAVSVRDRERLAQCQAKLVGFFRGLVSGNRRGPSLRSFMYQGYEVFYLDVPEEEFLVAPAWCLAKDRLIVALFPQTVQSRLAWDPAADAGLAQRPEVAGLFDQDRHPILLAFSDTRPLFELCYPVLQVAAQWPLKELQRRGDLAVDLSILPPTRVIARHLGPGTTAVYRVPDGLEIVQQSSLPLAPPAVAAPLLAGFGAGGWLAARAARQTAQSMNQLRQIMLAWHNYHDVYKGFPAAYNTDKDGKPLLSWRVHILPFIEQQALYQQFHLDEPWDSEHNRRLIAQMPDVFRAPGSKAPPGHTNYLAVGGQDGVAQPPKEDQRGRTTGVTGVHLRDIRDGTSNTIAVVEVSDQDAVIWTKPDDFEPDPDNPLAGLIGLRRDGFLAAFCDGSVRRIPATIDAATLRALFTRSKGEVVRLPN